MASGREVREAGLRKELALAEETLQLGCGRFGRIRCVTDVDHFIDTEVATDRAFWRSLRVGGAEQVAHLSDDIFAFQGESNDGSFAHELDDFREKGLIGDVRVVIGENRVIELHHFNATNPEAGGLEAREDGASKVFFDGIWLEQNEGCLCVHRHWGSRYPSRKQVFFLARFGHFEHFLHQDHISSCHPVGCGVM